jgi:hypothetical protein
VEHVEKDEAKAALEMLFRAKPHAPGAQALVWDMILRGAHLRRVMNELGLLPIVPVPAKDNPEKGRGRRAGTYVPKIIDLDVIPVVHPDGSTVLVTISGRNGWVTIKELTETGAPHYEHLRVVRIQRHPDRERFRFYGQYRLPERYASQIVTVRHHQNEEDDKRGLNRAENLRAIPQGSEDFTRLYRFKPDAESINSGIERSLDDQRASAKGWRALMVDLLGHARLVNAITLARSRGRARASPAA